MAKRLPKRIGDKQMMDIMYYDYHCGRHPDQCVTRDDIKVIGAKDQKRFVVGAHTAYIIERPKVFKKRLSDKCSHQIQESNPKHWTFFRTMEALSLDDSYMAQVMTCDNNDVYWIVPDYWHNQELSIAIEKLDMSDATIILFGRFNHRRMYAERRTDKFTTNKNKRIKRLSL